MKLIIQIPCFNEEETLPKTIADLPKHLDGIDEIEYLIINDGCTDNTVAVARECGVQHFVTFRNNRGIASGFMAGLDACVHLGADLIVNTDADNQYCGADIERLVQPILNGKADIVIGIRPIDTTEHWSKRKKVLQHIGSWVVRIASNSDVPDAPSGFRAYSREAALRTNVVNEYTYTLETIIQAGQNRLAMTTVPIHTNNEMRPSRLFPSISEYIKRSASVIIRSYMMYKPLRFFTVFGGILFIIGVIIGIRFLYLMSAGDGSGHIQSLILAAIFLLMGSHAITLGFLSDVIASSRKLIEDVQYRVRKLESGKSEK